MDQSSPDPTASELSPVEIAALTSQIVSAFLGGHKVGAGELPTIIDSVHGALSSLDKAEPAKPEKPVPSIPIRKTINDEYLISLEDGKRYKSLKRHLTGRGLTPAEYRDKWDLPRDYPMVAPAYARHRSELAKSLGLGQQRRRTTPDVKPASARSVRKQAGV